MNCLLAACLGVVLGPRRCGRTLRILGLGGLVLFSLPVVSGCLTFLLERGLNPPPPPVAPPQAIVILSGDETEIQIGKDIAFRPGPLTLEREQEGASLDRATHLPVLVSGGQIRNGAPSLAAIMASSLDADFGIQVKWREDKSLDTWANATDSAAMLHAAGINSVYLVTHAWHMHRALVAFRRAGLQAAAAPVAVDNKPDLRPGAFVPAAHAWQESYWGMHELIGWAWYALKP